MADVAVVGVGVTVDDGRSPPSLRLATAPTPRAVLPVCR